MPNISSYKVILSSSALILIIVLLFLFSPPGSVTLPAIALPLKEWTITQPEPDKIATTLTNNLKGTTETFQVIQYNRPEIVRFGFADKVSNGATVQAGQTIARLQSFEEKFRLAQLSGDYEVARNQVELLLAGAKPEVREEAERALEYARKQKETFLPQLERRRQLYAQELITKEELEVAESTFELYQINEQLREANLAALSTGARAEEIRVAEAKVAALEKQVSALEEILGAHEFVSPISGIVVQSQNPTELLKVVKTDTMVLVIPVPADKAVYTDQPISYNSGDGSTATTLVSVNSEIHLINGRSCFLARAIVENGSGEFIANQRVMVSMAIKRSLGASIRRQWSNFRYGLGGY